MIKIAPSLLAADFSQLAAEVKKIDAAGADFLHLDVMDGHFVPNLTIGPALVKSLRPHSRLVFDVHLMVEHPDRYCSDFAAAGADIITVHAEACPHLHRTLTSIKELDLKAGIALNPATPLSVLEEILPLADLVLVMSVNPGFGGQSFIAGMLAKIARLREMLQALPGQRLLEVDGGIGLANAGRVIRAGADVLVAGTAVFGAPDPGIAINALRELASKEKGD